MYKDDNESIRNNEGETSQASPSRVSGNVNDWLESTMISGIAAVARGRRFLERCYRLGDNDVFCGRGSVGFNHIGNQRFRTIIEASLERYMNANLRTEKSSIIFEIVDRIRLLSPTGGFVKKDVATGLFYEVGDLVAVR
jgi:hypothetical protein